MRIIENLLRTLQAILVGFFTAMSIDGLTDLQEFSLWFGCAVLFVWFILDIYREARGSW